MTRTQIIILVSSIVVVGGVGGFLYYRNKKKSESADSEDSDSGTTTNKTGYSNGVLYYGINADQTRQLQTKLNSFIQSGALGKVAGLFGLGYTPSQSTQYTFSRNADGSVIYRYRDSATSEWSGWHSQWKVASSNDGNAKAYARWQQDGEPTGVAYPYNGGDPVYDASTEAATTSSNNVTVPATPTSGNALDNFKSAIQSSLTNGGLSVDGAYGKRTMAVVSALQIYLNASKNAGLSVDGKYGPKTDAATGWGICS